MRHAFHVDDETSHAISLANEMFILTTGPIEGLRGMRRFFQTFGAGFRNFATACASFTRRIQARSFSHASQGLGQYQAA